MAENHDIQESDSFRSSAKQKSNSSSVNSTRERSPFYDSDSQSDTPPGQGSALSTRSSRSSLVASGLSTSQPSTEHEFEAGTGDNVRVVVRTRPLSQLEVDRGDKNIIKLPGDGAVWIDNSYGQIKPFTFNTAFGEETNQKQMFEECGITHLVDMALEGYSCTAFAFGQTGSGKTYTITGPTSAEETHEEQVLPDADMQGLIERCFQYMFMVMGRNAETVNYTLKASYLEVYNEKVKDLLNPSSARDSLPVRWSRDKGFYVENLFYVECDGLDDVIAVLEEGLKYRQVGSHMLNDHSSRSHSMLTVYVDIETIDSEDDRDFLVVKHGKLSLVDLAGSERVKETKAVGGTFAESQNINKSLLTLGNCISALSDPRKKGGHIPYRDSKLTKLLADSLGGDGVTLMIACISPSSYVVSDTLNTLRYAHRAKRIKNKPVVRMDPKEKLLLSLKREIKLLRTENNYFRQQLGLSTTESQTSVNSNDAAQQRHERAPPLDSAPRESPKRGQNSQLTPPDLPGDQMRLNTASMAVGANTGLYDMLQQYMVENESLRSENSDLLHNREEISKERMVVSRENDRLLRKLEHLERIVVSSPMLGRAMSGDQAGRLTDVERASSLPEEHFPAHSGYGASPQSSLFHRDPVFRVNSGPAQVFTRRRASSDRGDDLSSSRFPPIASGPYPNYVAQDRRTQPPPSQPPQQQNAYAYAGPRQEAFEGAGSQGVPERMPVEHHVTPQGNVPKPHAAKPMKKTSVSDRQKPNVTNGYAHRFALQKEKKAKETQNRKISGAEPRPTQAQQQAQQSSAPFSGPPVTNVPMHQELTSYPAQNSVPPSGPHFTSAPMHQEVTSYPTNGPPHAMNQIPSNGWEQELSNLDNQIEYNYKSAYQPRYNRNFPR